MATIVPHAKKSGPDWEFDRTNMREWSWKEFIAQLRDEDIRTVVHGADGRSGGLVGFEFSVRPQSYDHLRHMALKQAGKNAGNHMLPMWDFVVHRDDGTGLRLHPRRLKPLIDTVEVKGHLEQVPPPARGFGASDGRGTCKKYKEFGVLGKVRFDPDKAPPSEEGAEGGKNNS